MKLALWLLLLPSLLDPAVLANGTYQIPPGEWRSLHFPVSHVPLRLECRFQVLSHPGAARALLLAREDLEHFAAHQPYGYLTGTGEQSRGSFRFDIRQTGTFAVLLINSSASRLPSPVQLYVTLGPFPASPGPNVTFLSPGRKLATIALSVGGFLALLTWSVTRLLRAMRRNTPSVD